MREKTSLGVYESGMAERGAEGWRGREREKGRERKGETMNKYQV